MSNYSFLYRTSLEHRAISVYIYLDGRANSKGECWPSIGRIASVTERDNAMVAEITRLVVCSFKNPLFVIIYVMGTCSHKATDRLPLRSTNIYNKVYSAVEIYDFGDGVWFLMRRRSIKVHSAVEIYDFGDGVWFL